MSIPIGSKVVLLKSFIFQGMFGNPEAGSIGIVQEEVMGSDWLRVSWYKGVCNHKPITEEVLANIHKCDLKVIP